MGVVVVARAVDVVVAGAGVVVLVVDVSLVGVVVVLGAVVVDLVVVDLVVVGLAVAVLGVVVLGAVVAGLVVGRAHKRLFESPTRRRPWWWACWQVADWQASRLAGVVVSAPTKGYPRYGEESAERPTTKDKNKPLIVQQRAPPRATTR